ncbi:MAG TPA: aminoacylase, partial [Candidatus Latescibacteria bacterium]|nr:aminoacylase [Candidatus Latescibacterota bacterium]
GGMAYLIRTLVRERKVMTIERLVERITRFPAKRMSLHARGILEAGSKADVVLFDPEAITDRATIVDPCRYSEGVRWSFVNGTPVVQDGNTTGARPGKVLRNLAN